MRFVFRQVFTTRDYRTGMFHCLTFWIGKYEVTNAEFAEFVDAGGYEQEEFWLGLERSAMARHLSPSLPTRRGAPVPSTWRLGSLFTGSGELPGRRGELV